MRLPVRMLPSAARGGWSMMPGRAGSTPRVMAGGPSMMMLTQRIWIAVKGVGKPNSGAPSTVRMAPMLVES